MPVPQEINSIYCGTGRRADACSTRNKFYLLWNEPESPFIKGLLRM
ncbi:MULTISPECIES: hypothetical protein [unclassified Microcoleus]